VHALQRWKRAAFAVGALGGLLSLVAAVVEPRHWWPLALAAIALFVATVATQASIRFGGQHHTADDDSVDQIRVLLLAGEDALCHRNAVAPSWGNRIKKWGFQQLLLGTVTTKPAISNCWGMRALKSIKSCVDFYNSEVANLNRVISPRRNQYRSFCTTFQRNSRWLQFS